MDTVTETDREARLNGILLQFCEANQAGQTPDRDAWLTRHAEFRQELEDFFKNYDSVDHFAEPIRDALGQSWPGQKKAGPDLAKALGDFQLLREIGRGGMGVVYEAEQISLHRRVALKVLPFAAAFDPRHLQRFRNEAQAAAHLHHPHIVPVYAVGTERGVHYYAMQFIEGQSLANLIDEFRDPILMPAPAGTTQELLVTERYSKSRRFFQRVANLGKEAADALEYAHQMGVIHRDVKPGNLLLDTRGQLWIADFGLAHFRNETGLTLTGEVLGTLRYASPEQTLAQRGLVDHRSDIYSLGATLYELLTLQTLFGGRDRQELLNQIALEEPTPPRLIEPAIPVELETILLKALSKRPEERYATAQEMSNDLQRFLDDKPVLARRPSMRERVVKWGRRHRTVAVSILVVLVMGMLGLLLSTILIAGAYDRERLKAEEAQAQRAKAELGFRQARHAVDMFTRLAEEELVKSPMFNEPRRRFLEAALLYYQDFIAEQRDNPGIQAELAQSHARVSKLLGELSALQGHVQFMLLEEPAVWKDLKLDDDQRRRIQEISRDWGEKARPGPRATSQERQTQLAELARWHEKEVEEILNEAQRVRLKQIALQRKQVGPFAFRDPEVAEALGLTDVQKTAIRKLQDETEQIIFGPMLFPGGMHKPPPPMHKDENWKTAHEKILSLLTESQRAQYRKMIGAPFEGPHHGNFFGFGLPPGFGPGDGPPNKMKIKLPDPNFFREDER